MLQGQILPDVDCAVANRSELGQVAMLGSQINVGTIGGYAHRIIVTLGEVEDRARVEIRWVRYVCYWNAVEELYVGPESKVPPEDEILQEPAQVRVEDVRNDHRR